MFKVGQTVRFKPIDHLLQSHWPRDAAERWAGKTRVVRELWGDMVAVDRFERYNCVLMRDVMPIDSQMMIPFGEQCV